MSEAPARLSPEDFALRLALTALLRGQKRRKARAQLEDAAEMLRFMIPRDLGANVKHLRSPPADALVLHDAARRVLAAVLAELEGCA